MPAALALSIAVVGIALLLRWNGYAYPERTSALWIPQAWLLLIASRSPGLWFRMGGTMSSEALQEGSPFDRATFAALILVALVVVLLRSARCSRIIKSNAPLCALLALAGLSLAWSEYPFVALKRLVKEFGNAAMILIVLSESKPKAAAQLVLSRCGVVLVPLSIVLWRYFPAYGRQYHPDTGELMVTGVTVGKNGLGALCMVAFLFCLWRVLNRFVPIPRSREGRLVLTSDILVGVAAAWLLSTIDSMTALLLAIAGSIGLVALRWRQTAATRLAVVGVVLLIALTPLFLLYAQVTARNLAVVQGRQATFWGRVAMWPQLVDLSSGTWLLGVGYGSYWLGPRLETIWTKYPWLPTEAHNGFVETYLELGLVGVGFLTWLLVAAARDAARGGEREEPNWAGLRVTLLLVGVAYNVTEAAFKGGHLVWFCILLVALTGVCSHSREPCCSGKGLNRRRVGRSDVGREPRRPLLAGTVMPSLAFGGSPLPVSFGPEPGVFGPTGWRLQGAHLSLRPWGPP